MGLFWLPLTMLPVSISIITNITNIIMPSTEALALRAHGRTGPVRHQLLISFRLRLLPLERDLLLLHETDLRPRAHHRRFPFVRGRCCCYRRGRCRPSSICASRSVVCAIGSDILGSALFRRLEAGRCCFSVAVLALA